MKFRIIGSSLRQISKITIPSKNLPIPLQGIGVKKYANDMFQNSLTVFWEISRIMLPIMILMRIAESYGIIEYISLFFRPVMTLLNLPPEAAIVCVTTILTGLYGGIATLPLLLAQDLTAAQMTSICTMMLFAHGIPVEQAIVRRAGVTFWGTTLLRIGAAILAALLIDLVSKVTGFLSHPQPMENFSQFALDDLSHLEWMLATLKGLGVIYLVLTCLLLMMDMFNSLGITNILNRLLSPIMRLSGIDPSVSTITTAGILLGLAYGGGLIIAQGSNSSITAESKYYALCWISLCHGLIEDVALMVAVGGNFWVLLVGRIILTIFLIRMLMLFHRIFPLK